MEIAMGVVRMDFVSGGGWDEVRRTILSVSTTHAYRILGYRMNSNHEYLSGAAGGESGLFAVLRSAPVRVDFSSQGALRFVSLGVSRMLNHPSGLGSLLTTIGKIFDISGSTHTVLRADSGWVPFAKEYLVPGVYLDAVQDTDGVNAPQGWLAWEVHYERVRKSAVQLAAIATGRGWDADSSEDEFPVSTGNVGGGGGGGEVPLIG